MFDIGYEDIDHANTTMTKDSGESQIAESYHAEVVILAPFLLLAVGAFLRQTTRNLPLPYTMQLLILGTIIGAFLRDEQWEGTLQQSMKILATIRPHVMLHLFLPPLIFESAASLEWHIFTRAKWYILSLAGPGLLLTSGLTGVTIFYILNSSERFINDLGASGCPQNAWSFPTAMMLGVIMSATDPVAVVALLKELGCKASLSTSIEGESLLNDGTALVMYTILVKLAEGDLSDSVGDYLVTFVKMSIGGALFGTTVAVLLVQWLRMIFNDALGEISITISAAYLCFFVAEHYFHISGVLAVVCLGLYFGHSGKTAVSPEVAHFLEEFWEEMGFIGNTLIFVVAGTIIGYKLPSFPASDFAQMFIMYLVCTVIRAIVLGLIYALFRVFGIDIMYKDQIIATWAGLRGAVGLSLAMMVFGNGNICTPIREVFIFHTAGIVVLTVCINSITMPKLVSILGLDSVAPSKQIIYEQAMRNLCETGRKQEINLRADHLFDSTIWDEARKFYFSVDTGEKSYMQQNEIDDFDDKELRRRVLMVTKQSYWSQFQEGLLSPQSVSYLIHHSDVALDNECHLDEWKTYEQLIHLGSSLDKHTEKLVASQGSSPSEKRRVKLLNCLDSIPVIISILLLVFASCVLPFTLDPSSKAFVVIENTTTAIFMLELLIRIYCLQDWRHPCAVDPYIAIDIVAVTLDIILLSAEDLFGEFSGFTKSIRSIRFLRLFRLLRLARLASRLNKAKIAAMNEPVSLIEKKRNSRVSSWLKRYQRRYLARNLGLGFEVASAFKTAREEALLTLKHLQTEENHKHLDIITQMLEQDLKLCKTKLLDIQRLYSEIAASITTSLAARTVLNKQRRAIAGFHHDGLIDVNEYKKLKGSVEYQMKTLTFHPPIISMPNKIDILGQIPWLECVNTKELSAIAASFEDAVFQRGDILVKQDENSKSVHVLARGTVAVSFRAESGETFEIDELGMGSVFGEISWALNCIRGATIVATSPGLMFTICGEKLQDIAGSNKELERRLWETCGRRLSENVLATGVRYLDRNQIREMVHDMDLHTIDPMNKKLKFFDYGKVILLRGTAIIDQYGKHKLIEAPNVIPSNVNEIIFDVEFSTDAKFMCHRHALEGDASDKYKPLHRKISLSELEINNPHVKPVNDHQHESELNLRAATLGRRYSYSILQHSWRNLHREKFGSNRRSTMDVGSAMRAGEGIQLSRKKPIQLKGKDSLDAQV